MKILVSSSNILDGLKRVNTIQNWDDQYFDVEIISKMFTLSLNDVQQMTIMVETKWDWYGQIGGASLLRLVKLLNSIGDQPIVLVFEDGKTSIQVDNILL